MDFCVLMAFSGFSVVSMVLVDFGDFDNFGGFCWILVVLLDSNGF